MTTTRFGLRSLPTYYKGITFRSRLEARWAIFFDRLGLQWEYEPEGLEIHRRSFSFFAQQSLPEKFGYVPDFYLPEIDCFYEVKGSLTPQETFRLMEIALAITTPHGGRPYENDGKGFFVVGNFRHGVLPAQHRLEGYKGTVRCTDFSTGLHGDNFEIWQLNSDSDLKWMADVLCNGTEPLSRCHYKEIIPAIEFAVSARFEDGRHV